MGPVRCAKLTSWKPLIITLLLFDQVDRSLVEQATCCTQPHMLSQLPNLWVPLHPAIEKWSWDLLKILTPWVVDRDWPIYKILLGVLDLQLVLLKAEPWTWSRIREIGSLFGWIREPWMRRQKKEEKTTLSPYMSPPNSCRLGSTNYSHKTV